MLDGQPAQACPDARPPRVARPPGRVEGKDEADDMKGTAQALAIATIVIGWLGAAGAGAAPQQSPPQTPPPATAPAAPAAPDAPAPAATPPAAQTATLPAAEADTAVFVGAGDIAKCEILGGAVATARLLDQIPGTVFTVGDHAYPDGTPEQWQKCYVPTWGRHKARTRPSPGNHDYHTDEARPYFEYFGEAAGPGRLGYYSYDLAGWHIVSLNSYVAADKRSDQAVWLKKDLAEHPSDCILAYWHIPVFSSGSHGNSPLMRDIWKILYEAGAEIVVNGHDHLYERFAPQDPDGKADPTGIRQFTVGTGGGGVYKFKSTQRNSEVRDNSTYGVIKFTLGPGRYTWEFVPMTNQPFTDSGSGTCTPRK